MLSLSMPILGLYFLQALYHQNAAVTWGLAVQRADIRIELISENPYGLFSVIAHGLTKRSEEQSPKKHRALRVVAKFFIQPSLYRR